MARLTSVFSVSSRNLKLLGPFLPPYQLREDKTLRMNWNRTQVFLPYPPDCSKIGQRLGDLLGSYIRLDVKLLGELK